MSNWVPLETIIGTTVMPPAAAAILRQAVQHIAAENGISPNNRWRCLEYLAADYLAGEHDG